MDPQLLIGIGTVAGSLLVAAAGYIKNRGDVKVGVRSATREDQAAWDARYKSILEEVRQNLVDPLSEEVARLRGEVAELREDLASEQQELREERSRYRAALTHIRTLTAWMGLHMPPGTPQPPEPPEHITGDLH